MTDIILIAVVALILGLAIRYIIKEKKKGTVCVGCPMAGECARRRAEAKAKGDTVSCPSCSSSCSSAE